MTHLFNFTTEELFVILDKNINNNSYDRFISKILNNNVSYKDLKYRLFFEDLFEKYYNKSYDRIHERFSESKIIKIAFVIKSNGYRLNPYCIKKVYDFWTIAAIKFVERYSYKLDKNNKILERLYSFENNPIAIKPISYKILHKEY